MASQTTSVLFEERIEVPLTVRSLDDFRRWALSDEFPKTGRIDFIDGNIEVTASPEDFYRHGGLKTEIAGVVCRRVKLGKLGRVLIGRGRYSNPAAGLSVEPDINFFSYEALESGRLRLIPKSGGEPGHYIEMEGATDLVVEIVDYNSVTKDTRRLPSAYFQAGVREFWLADARSENPIFIIHRPGPDGFEPVAADADGFQPSAVLGRRYRLDSMRDSKGNWEFDLREEA